MAEDIAPKLWAQIWKQFRLLAERDREIQEIEEKIAGWQASHVDTAMYSIRIGEHASSALKSSLTASSLPDGKLYYNIGERTIRPVMEASHGLVNDIGEKIQTQLNRKAGLGMDPILPELDEDRVEGIISRLAEEDGVEDAAWMLDEPVKNLTQSFADNFVRENADFQYRSGLKPKITRIAMWNCCAWCLDLAGTYDYRDAPRDIYRRHAYCRCVVTYDPGDGRRQNVWSRQWADDTDMEEGRAVQELTGRIVRGTSISSISSEAAAAVRNRSVSRDDLMNAVRKPLKVTEPKTSKSGETVFRVIGDKATLSIDARSGEVVAISRTRTDTAKALKGSSGGSRGGRKRRQL